MTTQNQHLPQISNLSYELVQLEEASSIYESHMGAVVEAQAIDDKVQIKRVLATPSYRIALMALVSRGKIGKVLIDSMELTYVGARLGVPLHLTIKKLTKRVVVALLSKVLDDLFGARLSSTDKAIAAINIVERIPIYSIEEILRILSWGKSGHFGPIKFLSCDTINEWITAYDQEMDAEMAKLAQASKERPSANRGSTTDPRSLRGLFEATITRKEERVLKQGIQGYYQETFKEPV